MTKQPRKDHGKPVNVRLNAEDRAAIDGISEELFDGSISKTIRVALKQLEQIKVPRITQTLPAVPGTFAVFQDPEKPETVLKLPLVAMALIEGINSSWVEGLVISGNQITRVSDFPTFKRYWQPNQELAGFQSADEFYSEISKFNSGI